MAKVVKLKQSKIKKFFKNLVKKIKAFIKEERRLAKAYRKQLLKETKK